MAKVDTFVEDFLAHESRYDPVKAHEYYMRTRELKGGDPKNLTDDQKEGIAYVKDVIGKERKQAFVTAAAQNKQMVETLQKNAQARREEIQKKLHELMDKLAEEAQNERDRLTDETQAKIDALPDMPAGLSKQQRAEFSAKRREEIAKIRGDAKVARKQSGIDAKSKRAASQEVGKAQREQVATELKGSLEKARQNYESAREAIKSKYEGELRKEIGSIVNSSQEE